MTESFEPKSRERKLDRDIESIAQEFGLIHDGEFPYEVKESSGLRFIRDPAEPKLKPGEMLVYPFHDEAEDLLAVVERVYSKRGKAFSLCVDSFCGGGHSGLPIIKKNIAENLKGHDVNPRSVRLAEANAKLNNISNAEFSLASIFDTIEPSAGNTLYIANPPFALRAQGASLDIVRDGGDNALVLWEAFIRKAVPALRENDVICSVVQTRVSKSGNIEAEELFKKVAEGHAVSALEVSLIPNRKLWRGFNGIKEQNNPMPIDMMYVKADPKDTAAVQMWKDESERQKAAGYDKFGYYSVIVTK